MAPAEERRATDVERLFAEPVPDEIIVAAT
jgi:hypothetical protein